MNNRKPIRWRGWVAAGLLAAALIAFVVWPTDQPAPAPAVSTPKTAPAPTIVPQPLPVLDRAALIDAAAVAASQFAAGQPAGSAGPQLAGRRFQLALPFGCGGGDASEDALRQGWRFDETSKTLRIAATPELFSQTAVENVAGEAPSAEGPPAREGFWIDYPWLREPVCPALPLASSSEASEPTGTLAIVRTTTSGEPRRGRDAGSPYSLSVRTESATAPGAQGLRLLIEGRFEANGEPPVQCTATSASVRPTCIFVARFDRVAITAADGAVTYGEWVE